MKYEISEKLLQDIRQETTRIMEEVIQNRRYLHMHPEVGYDTQETEIWVKSQLQKEQIQILDSKVGVLGLIPGKCHDRMVGLRADMDALCLQEENETDYKSKVPGRMHACGHDGHTAMFLGAAKLLKKHCDKLATDILLIFQPAEEGPTPGGAKPMLEEMRRLGIADKIEHIFGQHLFNDYPVGTAGCKFGSVASSTDEFYITVIGKGGHAGHPDKTIDALSIGAKIVTGMESFMSRQMDPLDPAVFSTGIFHSGSAINIVADTAKISGTIRCQKNETREYILDGMKRLVEGVCRAYGADCEIKIIRGLPVLMNDSETAEYAKEAIITAIGKERFFHVESPMMGAEDFTYFAQAIPSAFLYLGSSNPEKGFSYLGHHPKFDFDENAMETGIQILCSLALGMQ